LTAHSRPERCPCCSGRTGLRGPVPEAIPFSSRPALLFESIGRPVHPAAGVRGRQRVRRGLNWLARTACGCPWSGDDVITQLQLKSRALSPDGACHGELGGPQAGASRGTGRRLSRAPPREGPELPITSTMISTRRNSAAFCAARLAHGAPPRDGRYGRTHATAMTSPIASTNCPPPTAQLCHPSVGAECVDIRLIQALLGHAKLETMRSTRRSRPT
jgi:hypothetical protein